MPNGEFHEADLHDLPLPDDHVDLVVCALSLVHVPHLEPVLAEFVRVLRPGGNLVISDQRGLIPGIALPVVESRARRKPWLHADPGAGSRATTLRLRYPSASRYAGVKSRGPSPLVDSSGVDIHGGEAQEHVPGEPPNIWALHRWCPAATNAAYRDKPLVIIWHFQLGGA